MKKILISAFCSLAILCSAFTQEAKAAYPYDRPINIVVPFGPGGSMDIAARILGDYLLQKHKINVNVINKPGGSQAIGMNDVLRARPDGYTIAFPTFSALATTPKLSNVGYDINSVKPICQVTTLPATMAVHKDSGIKTLADFIEKAKADPENTVFATTAAISYQRILFTKILNRFHDGLKVRHIAYNSNHEVSTAVLGKHVTAGVNIPANIAPYAESGDFVVLAIAGTERHPEFPDTPTFAEIYKDQMTPEDNIWISVSSWGGFLASNKVSDDKIETLSKLFKEALEDPEVIEKFNKVKIDIVYLDSRDFMQEIINSSNLVDSLLQGKKTLD